MSYTFDNIDEWVADLGTKSKATQFHAYARLERDKERNAAIQGVINRFDPNNRHHGAKEVVIINDDMAIVTFTATKGDVHYIPVVKDHHSVNWFTTFEGAIIGALSLLKTGDVSAAKYAGKVLDIEL